MPEIAPSDVYYTIEKKERAEIKIKSSKFIASVSYVPDKESATKFLEDIRSEFYDATHNCFAYRFGSSGLEFRFSDDGEPNGSSGKPILFTIQKFGFSDIIVVVTRYFGGTKLGVGGLVRAYSDATSEVLSLCKKQPIYSTTALQVFCVYEDINAVKRLINQYAVAIEENYSDAVDIKAQILNSKVDIFRRELTEQTKGRAGIVYL